jgi:ATP-dependent RNA helicase DDX56/DBP9
MGGATREKKSKKRKIEKMAEEKKQGETVEETLSFDSFQLEPRLLKAVLNQFQKPTLVQAAAIPLALNGRDIVARAKTGSGKTAAYVIPLIHQLLTKSVSAIADLILTCRTNKRSVPLHWYWYPQRN